MNNEEGPPETRSPQCRHLTRIQPNDFTHTQRERKREKGCHA